MNIVRVLLSNLVGGTITVRFPEKPPTEESYRGLVENDPERCIGCGQCAYACTTGAVAVHRQGEHYEWVYEPGKCTFCSRCLDRCPTHSLTMQSSRPPVYEQAGALNTELHMTRKKPAPRPAATPAAAPAKDASASAPAKETGGAGA